MRFAFLKAFSLAVAVLTCTLTNGQHPIRYQLEAGSMASSDRTPFWLRANQYGTVPLQAPAARLTAGLYGDYRPADSSSNKRKTDWGYGANIVLNAGSTSQFLLPEAYVKGRLGAFELYAGRRREVVGLVDTLLSTGAYSWSGNAQPIPKIQIGLQNFTSIPLTKGVLSIMGAFAHGWFENADRLVKGSYLHQKYLYGRLGKTSWLFRLYAGFNHQVIWAGYSPYISQFAAVNGKLPSNIRYYPAVVIGTRNSNPNDNTITSFEENRIGNHLGSVDFGVDVDLGNLNILAYRQFLYDDGSLFYGTNLDDGLSGIRIKNRHTSSNNAFFLRQITLEYLFTGSQGGDQFVIEENKRRGRDDYFNHSQFLDGWTYFGRTIGTPFLTPQAEVRADLPPRGGIANNRVSAFHLGLSALLFDKVDITTRLSYSLNAGTYSVPYPTIPKQFSGLFTASVPLNLFGGTTLNGSIGIDAGQLLPNSVGAYLSLRKTGLLGGGRTQPAIRNPRNGFN